MFMHLPGVLTDLLRHATYSLRQLDLSLLSQLWSLNESIQDFRQMLQDQDDRALSPPSPSPSPSSCDDGDADEFFSPSPLRLRPAPPPPPLRRTSNSSSANSSEYGTV
ncbi:leucine repeat adapter protein 25-like [Photinus pyralis]|uniref:leucine repeat adapter protein 25-like n=1 Tax=Photinus pyralis TaxID=7054 RepID=UPI0012674A6A|nr:leucine repeat adapter protein 25-like [Photinus pyralis]